MLKEKKKSESTLHPGKSSKIPAQKVSLCLAGGNHNILKPKQASFRHNLNIKFKTTKSSPEKTIINQDEYSSQKISNKNTTNLEPGTTSSNTSKQKDFDPSKMSSDEFLKSKLMKKQIDTKNKINRLNFTNPKFMHCNNITNNNSNIFNSNIISSNHKHQQIKNTSTSISNNNRNNKVLGQRLLSPISNNNSNNNSNNTNTNIHKQTNSQNGLNDLFQINNHHIISKQSNTQSQTTPASNQSSRKQSKEKKLIIQHHIQSTQINTNNNMFTNHNNNSTAPCSQQHASVLSGNKKTFNKNLLLQPRKNRILTNITRNCEKKRKINATHSNNNNHNNPNFLTSNNSIKSNVSSSSQDKILSIRRNAKNNNLNLKNILCSNTTSTKTHHLTSENSPNHRKLMTYQNKSNSKRCDKNKNNNSIINCNKTSNTKVKNNNNKQSANKNNYETDENENANRNIIYSLKTSRIRVSNMKINTEGGLFLRNSNTSKNKKENYNTNNTNSPNPSTENNNKNNNQHSKSTSHSISKKAITHKLSNYHSSNKKNKDSGNSSSNTSKKISIPPPSNINNFNNLNGKVKSNSKPAKSQRTIINQNIKCSNYTNKHINDNNTNIHLPFNNKHNAINHNQPLINELSFSFNNNASISSMKSQLIKEGTYYSLESEKLSSFIKKYHNKNNSYPPTKLTFYKFGRLIGRGAFGKVNLGLHILSGRIVAIKSFNKEKLENTEIAREKIYHEVNLMKNLRHNLIIRILETIETKKYILIIMENISGGDLLSFVKKRTKLSEKIAKFIFRQLITALKYIHSHNIVHRDIKLDNILIDLNNNIKLCDFGVGKQIHKGTLLKDKCGTPAYIAPEILRSEGYEGPPVDMWSSGVVLYAMLSGTVPFKPANLKELNKVIQKGEYPPIPDISKEAAHLINGLLEIDPKKRFTIEKVMNHPWLIMNSNDKNDESKLMLFTKAEMVLLSKANVDYRTSNKDEMMENFTLKNLDTNNDKCNKNVTTKSFIFAPFNSTFISVSEGDNENEISIEKSVIKFNNETQALNRIYELNYNGEIDHGVLIQHHSHSNQGEQKGNNQDQLKGGVSLSLNENEIINNNSLISGECFDVLETPISPRAEGNNKNELQRNLTSLTNTSTQLIDENVLKICESLGYGKEYMQIALAGNELNYATTTYYLLCCANDCCSY